MNKKLYRFYFHYNKPASIAAKKNKLTVHFRGMCIIADFIKVNVPTESKNKKTQPRCVIQGYCKSVEIKEGVAVIK